MFTIGANGQAQARWGRISGHQEIAESDTACIHNLLTDLEFRNEALPTLVVPVPLSPTLTPERPALLCDKTTFQDYRVRYQNNQPQQRGV
mgnify:CR=1 FL=1